MKAISSKKLLDILTQIKRTLVGLRRNSFAVAQFKSERDRLTVSASGSNIDILCQLPGSFDPFSFSAPLDAVISALKPLSGPVRIFANESAATLSDANTELQLCVVRPDSSKDSNREPVIMHTNPTRFAAALRFAAGTTDPESARYSIGRIHFRGCEGRMAATNGRQAFLETGLSLPSGEWFVPAKSLRNFRPLEKASSISVGAARERFIISLASNQQRWRLSIGTQMTGRFPELSSVVAATANPRTTLRIDEEDASDIVQILNPLLSGRLVPGRLTVELGRRMMIRFRSPASLVRDAIAYNCEDSANVNEDSESQANGGTTGNYSIELERSRLIGDQIRFAIDPNVFVNAILHGFRELSSRGHSYPISWDTERSKLICAVEYENISTIAPITASTNTPAMERAYSPESVSAGERAAFGGSLPFHTEFQLHF